MATQYDSSVILELRVGDVEEGFDVDGLVGGWVDGVDRSFTAVDSITVTSSSGIEVTNIGFLPTRIFAKFDATAAVARYFPYEVCIHAKINGNVRVIRLPLRVLEGC